jgi:hypothetical protein
MHYEVRERTRMSLTGYGKLYYTFETLQRIIEVAVRAVSTRREFLLKEAKALEQSKDVYKKDYRGVRIKTTDGITWEGKVNIGIKARVADLFTKTDDPFIVLSDVQRKNGTKTVLFVNKNNIVWVEPEDR